MLRANESAIYFVATFNRVALKDPLLHSYLRKHQPLKNTILNSEHRLIANWASEDAIEFVREFAFVGFCY